MSGFSIHGQAAAVRLLERAISDDRLHHAYLFTGPEHVGKTTLAMSFAQVLVCAPNDEACRRRVAANNFPDVRILEVGGDEDGPRAAIGIDAVRDLISAAHLRPYEGLRQVFIIQDAGRMTVEAANALLKLLEEPPPDVVLLLLAEDGESVLPTVFSRCQLVQLRPMPIAEVAAVLRDEFDVDAEHADSLARLSRGCAGWAIQAVSDQSFVTEAHQRIERIVAVMEEGIEGRFAFADEVARRFGRESDRADGRAELHAWRRWLRDVMLVQQRRSEDIAHTAWRATLEQHACAMSAADVVGWARALDRTMDAIERNANVRLALEAMLLEAPRLEGGSAA